MTGQTPSRVLLVDDDVATRTAVAKLLVRAGFDPVAVGTYHEAMSRLRNERIDVIVADVRLGEFNGLQLIAMSPAPIPAIIVTGFADPVIEADAKRLGAQYLLKPVQFSTLVSALERALTEPARQIVGPTRRWPRKTVSGTMSAHVAELPARILDISYGGLRFEIEHARAAALPPSFSITVPASHVSVHVDLVWKNRTDAARWLVGAAVSEADSAAVQAWHGLVDAVGA